MNNEFDNVPVHTSESLADNDEKALAKQEPNVTTMAPIAMNADQARQIAEVQVMMTVAKGDPRREVVVWEGMRRVCGRLRFANAAKYAFKRGTTLISGLGIKSIRELATIYGNIDCGYRVLDLEGDVSWVEAFAWDMQRNVRVVRKFPVRHWRDTKGGGKEVKAERDKYEIVAGMAQRRVRSCLEQLLPADYLEEAESIIDETLRKGDGRPMADRLRDIQVAFHEIGVNDAQLEVYLQHPIRAIVPEELPRLQQIYTSLRDGIMSISEVFPPVMADKRVVPKAKDKSTEKPQTAHNAAKTEKKGSTKAETEGDTGEPGVESDTARKAIVPPQDDDDIPFGNPDTVPTTEPGKDVDGEDDPFA